MQLKHNNKKYTIPTKASELSYKDFLKVKDWDGIHEAEFVEKLLDIDFATALEITDGYLKEDCFEYFRNNEYSKPDKIEIFGKKYKVHKNLFTESTAGQIAEFKNKLAQIKPDEWDEKIHILLPQILAIYFYTIIRNTVFNSVKYNEITYLIENCNYKDVLGVGFFLLKNYIKYQKMKNKDLAVQMQNKSKQESTN